jgi:hypothetical protein
MIVAILPQSRRRQQSARDESARRNFMDKNEKTLKDLAAEWEKIFGVKIAWYQSPDREMDAKVRVVMGVKAKEIEPRELALRKTNAVLLLVEFADDVDSNGMVAPRLFELSESASSEYRALSKAATSFGEFFEQGLIQ